MPEPKPSRLSQFLLALFILLGLAVVVFWVRSSTREMVEVRVSPVTHENLVSTVSTNGKIEPVQQYQAHAPAPGVVQKVYVSVGQKVKTGDLLLRLDDAEYASRVAAANSNLRSMEASATDLKNGGTQDERIGTTGELSRARLQAELAAATLATLQQLQQKGAASAAEIATAEQRVISTRSALETAQQRSSDRFSSQDRSRSAAQVVDAQANVAAAQSAYAKAVVRAPFSGTVYSVPVSDYDFVSGGEDMLDLADLNRIRVRAYFDEPEIGRLAPGQAVRIVWDAKPNRVWHGHIEIAPTTVITYGTRNVGECLISVDDAQGDLLPNTNVTVTVTVSQRFNVLSIPREALHTEGAVDFVYRVVNHHLQRTVVRVGALNLTRVEIVGGLTEKDTVALNATSNRDLANGLQVRAAE